MEAMELQDFVSQTLVQVIRGVKEAQDKTNEAGALISPKHHLSGSKNYLTHGGRLVEHVEFDVAVTTSEAAGSKGGLGIFVAGVGIGAKGTSDTSSLSVNRIKFSIPIVLPCQE